MDLSTTKIVINCHPTWCKDASPLCRCVGVCVFDWTLIGMLSHFQHVCLPQESLFQVFQPIKWSRAEISPVIRRDLKQKIKMQTSANSVLPRQGPMFVGSWSRVWVGISAHSLAQASSCENSGKCLSLPYGCWQKYATVYMLHCLIRVLVLPGNRSFKLYCCRCNQTHT